jgi:uroporphyrinogen decarboxylase
VYGVTYAEWAQDGELMAKSMIQAQKLVGFDGILGLVDLSVEAADFGQKMVFPIEDTPHPDYNDSFITDLVIARLFARSLYLNLGVLRNLCS